MKVSLDSSLSWQTGTLVFRNRSLLEVKQELEDRYGTEIPMYRWKQNTWYPFWQHLTTGLTRIHREIRLTLFLYYHLESDALMVRGIQFGTEA